MNRKAHQPSSLAGAKKHPARQHVQIFERARPRLLGIAYRILGSLAEAEDAVQDTFLRWQGTDVTAVESPDAWLTSACSRRAVDMLRAAYRSRVNYVGNWLPEPIHTSTEGEAEAGVELSSSLSAAFLLMLERLTPRERAAYLLYEIFELPYAEVAQSLSISELACRKLVSRAKASIGNAQARHQTTRERQKQLLAAFEGAIRLGRPGDLTEMLASDIRLTSDGGGKVPALIDVLIGHSVLTFLTERLHEWWADYQWEWFELNGALGFVLKQDGTVVATVSFAFDGSDRVTDIFIVRNPEKLAGLGATTIH